MEKLTKSCPLDNSALIHLAVHDQWHSNVFRLEVHLKTGVRPARLQLAADAAAARFPMLAAGIRRQRKEYVVVPCPERLYIRVDAQALAYMPMEEIADCAMRVLYGQKHIAVEFFHSLTDGAGGTQFLKALMMAYLEMPLEEADGKREWEDSYKKYAKWKPTALPGGASYLLPGAPQESRPLYKTTMTFSAKAMQAKAKEERTTLTAFFTALFAQTAMEMQLARKAPDKALLPVQIMVPVDLRRRFDSTSLRNFSLYALPKLTPEAAGASFSEIVESMTVQLRAQNAYSRLCTAIATNVELERRTAALPLWMKCAALRAGFEVWGGRSSCITVSNLGQAGFPEPVQQEIGRMDFLLTPRIHSPYNCGIVSVGDILSLTITRRGEEKGVERMLAAHLLELGAELSIEAERMQEVSL